MLRNKESLVTQLAELDFVMNAFNKKLAGSEEELSTVKSQLEETTQKLSEASSVDVEAVKAESHKAGFDEGYAKGLEKGEAEAAKKAQKNVSKQRLDEVREEAFHAGFNEGKAVGF